MSPLASLLTVIAVVSIVQGASRFMLEQFEGLGADLVLVQAGPLE